ncbi:hypothetical protein [Endozoicomonas numazuensis]|uniref:Uncharacterized protein n=1 Tax=Endozoicomonas numazuensis TaxID=1137799 RepID=A0A081NL17_9GAMM|nr:hypothetical protein [Endozoicomonas numazuensis]KEQ19140.1 hypothetical protein GZ78_03805 [Endozoicomonas numazuensis]
MITVKTDKAGAIQLSPHAHKLLPQKQHGQWLGYKLTHVDTEKNTPEPPSWFQHKSKNLSERLASYHGTLKGLLKPLINFCIKQQIHKVQQYADRILDLDDIKHIQAHVSEFDHQLRTLGNITVTTQTYGSKSLSWLRDEAIRTYLEICLEEGPLSAENVAELIELHQSIINHQYEDHSVGTDQLMGYLCLKAAEYTTDSENRQALLLHSRKLFNETQLAIEDDDMATFRSHWHSDLKSHKFTHHLPRM